MMRLAHLSDMHFCAAGEKLFDSLDVNAQNADIIHQLNQLDDPVDAIIITGDVVNDGHPEQYRQAAKILQYANCPVYLINGNHDERDAFCEAFRLLCPLIEVGRPIRYTLEYGGHQLLLVDSTIPGETHGAIDDELANWIEQHLKASELPTVLFMHHPPLSMNNAHMDPLRCINGSRLLALADRYPQFRGIYCGHNHRFSVSQYRQLVVVVAPATSVQIPCYRERSTPLYNMEPPSCLIHSITSEGRWVSHQHLLSRLNGERHFPWVKGMS
ncbi:phosphodiesterase [Celerinatantimonas sp. YJH-8]|uniref:phosphodiesterase n=1 Tax=Celerinatantimonas sp. YJH-8 TaxID=3228714 RepID=UPI0038C9A3F8